MEAGTKESDNLTQSKAVTAISPQEKSVLKDLARVNGENYVELPAKVVFTSKPDVASGNQTDNAFGKITVTDLDSGMLRFLLSWGALTRKNVIATVDVTAAFLNRTCLQDELSP